MEYAEKKRGVAIVIYVNVFSMYVVPSTNPQTRMIWMKSIIPLVNQVFIVLDVLHDSMKYPFILLLTV